MDKKTVLPKIFKVFFYLFLAATLAAAIVSLKNMIEDNPFNPYVFIPAGVVLFAAMTRAIVGTTYPGHHHGHKKKLKKVEPLEAEYRGGETFEADLDEQPVIA